MGRGGGGVSLSGLALLSLFFELLMSIALRAPRSRRQVLRVGGLEMWGVGVLLMESLLFSCSFLLVSNVLRDG